jgi:hypothetical protein
MTAVKFRDAVVEWTGSDCHTGPGRTGQRVGSALWFRVDGGEWRRLPFRSAFRLREALELSDTLADFLDLVAAEERR